LNCTRQAPVDSNVAVVVLPRNTEDNDAVRLRHALEDLGLLVLGVLQSERHHGVGELLDRLMELGLARVPSGKAVHELRHGRAGLRLTGHGLSRESNGGRLPDLGWPMANDRSEWPGRLVDTLHELVGTADKLASTFVVND